MRLLFGYAARIQVVGAANAARDGGFLLVANHISHFDPFIISAVIRRKIDWMTMAEFFPVPLVGLLLRAVDAFPADRSRADRKTIRTAIERVSDGRIVGLFPEGGIRNGTCSVLEGAPLRPGAATLGQLAGVPVLPCVIVGSDRLYSMKNWLPVRHTPIWIAFGDPISYFPELKKADARERIERQLNLAFKNLYAELRHKFSLKPDDLPHSPQERFGVRGHVRASKSGPAIAGSPHSTLTRLRATVVDSLMCTSMNLMQARHRLHARSRDELERYVEQCEKLTAREFYSVPPNGELTSKFNNHSRSVTWHSPIETKFPANNIARADLFPCERGWHAPTVLLLHALMSATHLGYRRWAAHFNRLGWNACFVHLPYHYSRVPAGYWNGELAITADLVSNAEGLRQGVIELRQLISALSEHGCEELGVMGTSYGGWIGALLAMVECDLRFVALMAPIVNIEHAIWENRATAFMRRELTRAKVDRALVARHFHLSSPLHNEPMCDPNRVLFVAGEFDLVAPMADIEAIHRKWRGSELVRVTQGHFGYRMMRETIERLKKRGL